MAFLPVPDVVCEVVEGATIATDPARATGWAGRTGAGVGSERRSGSITIERSSTCPADRARGSWGWIVIAVPCAGVAISTCRKRPGSTVAAGLGALEPTEPGTATEARMAMSATLATTFLCRTSAADRSTDRPHPAIAARWSPHQNRVSIRRDAESDVPTQRPARPA